LPSFFLKRVGFWIALVKKPVETTGASELQELQR
jgi:hypothetical protein